jgi:hypothetical protein
MPHHRMRPPRSGAEETRSIPSRVAVVLCVAPLLAACFPTTPRPPIAGSHPADPAAPAPPATYRPALGDYRSYRPVEPKPWTEQNQQVAPAEKP